MQQQLWYFHFSLWCILTWAGPLSFNVPLNFPYFYVSWHEPARWVLMIALVLWIFPNFMHFDMSWPSDPLWNKAVSMLTLLVWLFNKCTKIMFWCYSRCLNFLISRHLHCYFYYVLSCLFNVSLFLELHIYFHYFSLDI